VPISLDKQLFGFRPVRWQYQEPESDHHTCARAPATKVQAALAKGRSSRMPAATSDSPSTCAVLTAVMPGSVWIRFQLMGAPVLVLNSPMYKPVAVAAKRRGREGPSRANSEQ
jgi:hypothetical protein